MNTEQTTTQVSHDTLCKLLFTSFLQELLELAAPEVLEYVDLEGVNFLMQELITEPNQNKRIVDLVAQVKFLGEDAQFLIHLEAQASHKKDFSARMLEYFAKLYRIHELPIFPLAIFTYKYPKKEEPSKIEVNFPGQKILEFNFLTLQLNKLNWREFVRHNNNNPVATALMTMMNIPKKERHQVKIKFLRQLKSLNITQKKKNIIGVFGKKYLQLDEPGEILFYQELDKLEPQEKDSIMLLTNEWIDEGIEIGRREGTVQIIKIIKRLLAQKFGNNITPEVEKQISHFPLHIIGNLSEDLLDFQNKSDLDEWIKKHQSSLN